MNKMYEFYFTNDGRFACTKTLGNKQMHYYEDKALIMLRSKDRLNFNRAKVSEKKFRLSNNNTTVIIYDLEKFYENDLCSYIPYSLPKIQKAILKCQKKKHKNQEMKKSNARGLLVASSLVLMLLGASSGLIKSYSEDEFFLEAVEKEFDDLDIIEKKIDLEIDTTKRTINTNQLLEELDQDEKLEQVEEPVDNKVIPSTYLRYDMNIDEEKANYAYENFNEIVESYATKWGISPNLPMSMLTQESGGYNNNLMQIQFDSWIDMPLTVYNFNDNVHNTIVLTDNPKNYNGKGYICITREDLKNPKTNISVGCIIIRKSCESMNNHIAAGVQCYNFGVGNMNKVLTVTSDAVGMEIEDLLADQANLEFTNYTNIIDVGDPDYLQHVVRYTEQPEEGFSIKYVDDNGDIQEVSIAILPENVKSL